MNAELWCSALDSMLEGYDQGGTLCAGRAHKQGFCCLAVGGLAGAAEGLSVQELGG